MMLLGSLRLFDAGLFYSAQAQQQTTAVRVAQKVLREIRAWAREPAGAGLNFDDWSTWNGYDQPDPDHSGFRVRVNVADRELKSPCTEMENSYPLDQQKRLLSSYKTVEILVSWSNDQREFKLVSLVGDPARPLPISIDVKPESGGPPTLNRDDPATFLAAAVDAGGNPIPDVFFKWGVKPGETNGAIDPERHGQKATFVHQVRIANLPNLYTDGSAVIQANTVYHGRPAIGDSDPFTLLP